jgi:hypothetical protein
VRRLHHEEIAQTASRIQSEFERADEFVDERWARAFALEEGPHAPSAYDLIVMCNFLTQKTMLVELRQELQELARSLTPGGLLLILGGTGGKYPGLYASVGEVLKKSSRRSLTLVLDEELQALDLGWDRDLAASQLISSLRLLEMRAPNEFAMVSSDLPADVQPMNPADVRYPKFRVVAYKREGRFALSRRELRRRQRRVLP